MKLQTVLSVALLLIPFSYVSPSPERKGHEEDNVLGRWMTQDKNLIVEVYKTGVEYKAKIVWFDDKDDPSRPMNTRTDSHNPDITLRNRKLIGLDVLRNLNYNEQSDCWENGMIYDCRTGREWNSIATILPCGTLKVKGYWHFKCLSASMNFDRLN